MKIHQKLRLLGNRSCRESWTNRHNHQYWNTIGAIRLKAATRFGSITKSGGCEGVMIASGLTDDPDAGLRIPDAGVRAAAGGKRTARARAANQPIPVQPKTRSRTRIRASIEVLRTA